MPESTGTSAASNPTLTVEADIDGVPSPVDCAILFPLVRGCVGKIDEHTSAANPAAAAGARQNSSICGLLHRRRTPRLASSRVQAASLSTKPPMHRPPREISQSGTPSHGELRSEERR